MIICESEQGTAEWLQERCGLPTSSNFDKIVTSKGDRSASRLKYIYQLVGERISGQPVPMYNNYAMQRGTELEPEARAYYELLSDNVVQEVGFCMEDGGRWGGSPDGLIGDDGGLEIKCPEIHTHVGYLLANKLPTTYYQQVQGNLFVTGRKWWDFISYYPGIKPLIVRVLPDTVFHEILHEELVLISKEIELTTQKLMGEK